MGKNLNDIHAIGIFEGRLQEFRGKPGAGICESSHNIVNGFGWPPDKKRGTGLELHVPEPAIASRTVGFAVSGAGCWQNCSTQRAVMDYAVAFHTFDSS